MIQSGEKETLDDDLKLIASTADEVTTRTRNLIHALCDQVQSERNLRKYNEVKRVEDFKAKALGGENGG